MRYHMSIPRRDGSYSIICVVSHPVRLNIHIIIIIIHHKTWKHLHRSMPSLSYSFRPIPMPCYIGIIKDVLRCITYSCIMHPTVPPPRHNYSYIPSIPTNMSFLPYDNPYPPPPQQQHQIQPRLHHYHHSPIYPVLPHTINCPVTPGLSPMPYMDVFPSIMPYCTVPRTKQSKP